MIEAANRWKWMLALAALPLAGCVSPAPASFPTFAQIPSTPGDLRSPADWRRDIGAVKADGAKLAAETAPGTFSLGDTEAFAARTRALAANGGAAPDETADRAQAQAFVNSARQRATAPPSTR